MSPHGIGEYGMGMLWDPTAVPPAPVNTLTDEESTRDWWPFFCHAQRFTMEAPGEGKKMLWLPRLLSWRRDGDLEIFEIELRGRLGEMADKLVDALLTARMASKAHVSNPGDDPGEWLVILNHARLPRQIDMDPSSMLGRDPNVIYIGVSGSGPDAVWDPRIEPHGLLLGKTGSGKTELGSGILCQFHASGASIVVVTPTDRDVNFMMLSEVGHEVVTGEDDDAVARTAKAFREIDAEMGRRQRSMADTGDEIYQGPFRVIALDEPRWVLADQPGDTDDMKADRDVIRAAMAKLATRGRKAKCVVLVMDQEPYAENYGGTLGILKQLGLRLTLRQISSDGRGAAFGKLDDATRTALAQVVGESAASPPGRGIGMGLVQPGGAWEGFPVNMTALQVPQWRVADRRRFLGLDPDPLGRNTPEPEHEPEHQPEPEPEHPDDPGMTAHIRNTMSLADAKAFAAAADAETDPTAADFATWVATLAVPTVTLPDPVPHTLVADAGMISAGSQSMVAAWSALAVSGVVLVTSFLAAPFGAVGFAALGAVAVLWSILALAVSVHAGVVRPAMAAGFVGLCVAVGLIAGAVAAGLNGVGS